MAVTSTDVLIADLARRMGYNSADSTVRADMLRRLNTSLQNICQDHSLSFLVTYGTVTLTSGTDQVAVPAGLDTGKTITLGRAASNGRIEFVPPDEWYATRVDTYGSPTQTEPSFFTIVNVATAPTFLFKPGASGGNKTIPYLAQVIVTALTDNSSSRAQLPEGWENTLLLIDAEAEERRISNEAQWRELKDRADDRKERLYSSYRTTKEQAMTDREQKERKVSRDVLAVGK